MVFLDRNLGGGNEKICMVGLVSYWLIISTEAGIRG